MVTHGGHTSKSRLYDGWRGDDGTGYSVIGSRYSAGAGADGVIITLYLILGPQGEAFIKNTLTLSYIYILRNTLRLGKLRIMIAYGTY